MQEQQFTGAAPQLNQMNQNPQAMAQEYFADVPKPRPEEVVFEWKALARPFKKRTRQYYTTIFLIVFLISLILFFAGQFLPIAVVMTVAFLAYVISSVPPGDHVIKITTYGIRMGETLYYWESLGRFWLDERYGQRFFNVEVAYFPGRLMLLLKDKKQEKIVKEILSEVLLNEKPIPTSFEKAADWIGRKVPLE